jgi:hypothetical protein
MATQKLAAVPVQRIAETVSIRIEAASGKDRRTGDEYHVLKVSDSESGGRLNVSSVARHKMLCTLYGTAEGRARMDAAVERMVSSGRFTTTKSARKATNDDTETF